MGIRFLRRCWPQKKNIAEKLSELRKQFHQRRQMAITEELLDIVSGFEALSAKKGIIT